LQRSRCVLTDTADRESARGLITLLFAVATIGTTLVLIVSALVVEQAIHLRAIPAIPVAASDLFAEDPHAASLFDGSESDWLAADLQLRRIRIQFLSARTSLQQR
jgi:hypothetical protein